MVNPFGKDPDTVFAWKERHKQVEFEKSLLQQRVEQLNSEVESVKQLYNELRERYQTIEEDLSSNKRELLAMHNVAKERQNQLMDVERSMEASGIDRLKSENAKLKSQVEGYQASIARGSADDVTVSKPTSTGGSIMGSGKLIDSLTPIMLHKFDPENQRYQNAFVNLVEAVIAEGGVLEKIIGVLVKYGGNGPRKKIEQMVNNSGFNMALEALIEEKLVKIVDDSLYLTNSSDMAVLADTWNNMDLDELFTRLKQIIEKDPFDDVITAIGKFRDSLTESDLPITTMLFQIRKMSEGFEKRSMTRTEALKQVNEWYQKLTN